ncbi:DUF7793 family protein [Winogradskyella pulchriflava]|uniref:DUF7793 domain-containing protein n=1 Tax=Winogradskyella pulchriflava TaxID=1110688 RepID=A0ABV6Q9E4_9FLAO
MNNKDNYIKIGSTSFWLDSNGILNCKFSNKNPNYKLDKFISRLYINAIEKLCNGKPVPFLIDLRGTRGTFTEEAVKILAKSTLLKVLRLSESFVYDSIGMKLLIMSYKRMFDHYTPYQLFNEYQSAQAYCLVVKNDFYGSN